MRGANRVRTAPVKRAGAIRPERMPRLSKGRRAGSLVIDLSDFSAMQCIVLTADKLTAYGPLELRQAVIVAARLDYLAGYDPESFETGATLVPIAEPTENPNLLVLWQAGGPLHWTVPE
jgi:hypothetical protein